MLCNERERSGAFRARVEANLAHLCQCLGPGGGGGRLQMVLMQHPPSYLSNLGGQLGRGGVGGREGGGVLAARPGGGGAARNPLLPHAYLKGVWGMGV